MDRGKGFADYEGSPIALDKQYSARDRCYKRKRSRSPSRSPSSLRHGGCDENDRVAANVRNQSSASKAQTDCQKSSGNYGSDSGSCAGAKKRLLCDESCSVTNPSTDNEIDDGRNYNSLGFQRHPGNRDIWGNFKVGQASVIALDRRPTPRFEHDTQSGNNDIRTDAVNHNESGVSFVRFPILDDQSGEHVTLSFVASRIRNTRVVDTAGKDIAPFLGATGVGKTTTINYCCDAPMVEIRSDDRYDQTVRIDVCPSKRESFLRIGHGESMTKSIDFLVSPAKKTKTNPSKRQLQSDEILFCGLSTCHAYEYICSFNFLSDVL